MAKKNYQQLKQELDQLLIELQSDDLDIDEAFKKYEQGEKLVAELELLLASAENKVKKIEN